MQKVLLAAQKNEITEHFIYKKLARGTKKKHNRDILNKIAEDELEHYEFWKTHTKTDVNPDVFKIWIYFLTAKIFGLTFGVRLMERGESMAQVNYNKIAKEIPEAAHIAEDEDEHEQALIEILNEEKLEYIGSMVLGLNDALVELTGALAGLTLALQDTRLIALTGGITGIAASLSMAASEYLSTKTEDGEQDPLKASIYTGVAYVLTVIILIAPYLLVANYYLALGIALASAVLIIFVFTFYLSIAKNLPFKRRFFEMTGISLGVAALTFGIGYVIRMVWGIEV